MGILSHLLNGKPLDLSSEQELVKLIEAGEFDAVEGYNPRRTMQEALNLSHKRAEAVRDSIIAYAKENGLYIDRNRIQPVGVGVREAIVSKPSNIDEARKNMRVEFRLVRVDAPAATQPGSGL